MTKTLAAYCICGISSVFACKRFDETEILTFSVLWQSNSHSSCCRLCLWCAFMAWKHVGMFDYFITMIMCTLPFGYAVSSFCKESSIYCNFTSQYIHSWFNTNMSSHYIVNGGLAVWFFTVSNVLLCIRYFPSLCAVLGGVYSGVTEFNRDSMPYFVFCQTSRYLGLELQHSK
jgi:hypothetical protein